MSLTLTSPITGGAQTGFTSPTYSHVADTAPAVNSKQYAITALGGTQTGASAHSVGSPFTVTHFRPLRLNTLPAANPITGVVKGGGRNKYRQLVRKGALAYASATPDIVVVDTTISVPAGVETYSPAEVRAAISAAIGALNQLSAGFGDTAITGVI